MARKYALISELYRRTAHAVVSDGVAPSFVCTGLLI